MPGGNSTTSSKSTNKDRSKTGNTVQTLLAAKVDKEKPPPSKRTHSEVSNDSNCSFDLSNLMSLQKDIEEIKSGLGGITRKEDLDKATKDLFRTSDLEAIVTVIVKNLLKEFETSIETKIEEKVTEVRNEMQEKIDALAIENEDLKRKIQVLHTTTTSVRKDLNETGRLTKQALINSNFNEQYSRKNNIKVFNFPRKEKQNLRQDFIKTVKDDLKVELEERDVVAIHRIPSKQHGVFPVIVRLFNSDVKRSVMRVRKELRNDVRFSDDVTQANMELIQRLRDTELFESVWYYNCGVYGRTEEGLQLKFGIFDDIRTRLKQGR